MTILIDLDMKRKIQLNVTTKHKDFWYHYKWSRFELLMWDIMSYALELSLYQDLLYLIMFFIVWKLDLLMTQKDCVINLELFMSDNRSTYSYALSNSLVHLFIQFWYGDDADAKLVSIICRLHYTQPTSRLKFLVQNTNIDVIDI